MTLAAAHEIAPGGRQSNGETSNRAIEQSSKGGLAKHVLDCVNGSRFVHKHLDQLGHNLELLLVRAGENDCLEVGVDGLQRDLRMEPGVALLCFFALVALDGEALAGLRIGGVAEPDENGLALPRPFNRRAEKAVGAVGDRMANSAASTWCGLRSTRDPAMDRESASMLPVAPRSMRAWAQYLVWKEVITSFCSEQPASLAQARCRADVNSLRQRKSGSSRERGLWQR